MLVDLAKTVRNFSRDFTGARNFGSESQAIHGLQADLFQAAKELQADTIEAVIDPSKGGDPQERITLLARVNLAIAYAKQFFEDMISRAKENLRMDKASHELALAAK